MSASLQELRTSGRAPWLSYAKGLLGLAFVLGLVFASWAAGWYFIANAPGLPVSGKEIGDQADVLFGAASLALFIFSVVIAILALFGWKAIQELIEESVKKQIQNRLSDLEREMRGRVQTGLGFMIGELSTKPTSMRPTDPDRLSHAVELCQAGYKQLKGLGDRLELLGLNNLVYYLAVEARLDRKDFVLREANSLLAKGQELGTPRLLLTYCRAILVFSQDSQDSARAKEILLGLVDRANLQEYEKKEAKLYLGEFEKREAKSRSAPPSPANVA